MMLHEKADVIQETIDLLQQEYDSNHTEENHEQMFGVVLAINVLIGFKAEVDALAEQEAKNYAESTLNESLEIKEGTYLSNEAIKGNIKSFDELLASVPETEEEHEIARYRQP